ncbi:MAG: type VI secretion system-associated FHA domain protein TagH [Pseudomonadota bacterium]|nr:type VI secretion system-associated FHA domain protein TagH [Pseudomonadota bacterium]
MPITLSVQTYREEAPLLPLARRFDQLGGAIGRAAGNDLVLDDPSKYISRVHARIEFRDGGYYLIDVGSNPSLVNERPVGQGRDVRLADEDRLVIGAYQLVVIAADEGAPALPASPLQRAAVAAAPASLPAHADDSLAGASILDVGGDFNNPGFDPFGLDFFAKPAAPPAASFRGAESDHVSPEIQPFPMPFGAPPAPLYSAAPAPQAGGGGMAIPDEYDPLADYLPPRVVAPAVAPPPVAEPAPVSAPAPAPKPPARPAPPASSGGHARDNPVIQALMRGMGIAELTGKRSAEEIAELAGAMLREATAGTMSVLMARAMTKRESRLEMTMISSQANNPLKFFPDADSAMMQMMNSSMPGYMAPPRAFAGAFDDLKAHELAMMAGMRAALAGVLQRFDPAAIEQRLQVPTVLDKMLSANRKAKMWDRLVELYQQMALEADEDFQRLFGEKFGAAYEEQIQRLQQGRR